MPDGNEFICFLEPTRAGMVDQPTDTEAEAVEEHAAYLARLTEAGIVVLAGRTTEKPHVGIIILRAADRSAAEAIMHDDPALRAGVFRPRLQAFRIALHQERA
ncbi:MAG: YciI family protein [Planctomycetota bacterium]|nr:YciI family protein [Planctomycetota bacterium]